MYLSVEPGHLAKVRDMLVVVITSSLAKLDDDNTDDKNLSNLPTSARCDPLLVITPTNKILIRHVRVNAIADYYDIPQLKKLVNTKLQNVLETNWSADGFSHVIKEVFTSTTDKALRNIVSSTVVTHIEELIEHKDFAALEIMSDVAISIIRDIIKANKAKNGLLAEKIQVVESQLEATKSRLRSSERSYDYEKSVHDSDAFRAARTIEGFNGCITTLSETHKCRNITCNADFACYIERDGPVSEPTYMLRCARCRCRYNTS